MLYRRVGRTAIGTVGRLRILTLLAFLSATTLHAQALWNLTPPNLVTWGDVDGVVTNTYSQLTNAFALLPPGPWHAGLNQGYFTFSPGSSLAALTNYCPCSTQYGVRTWAMNVVETQSTPRVWLYQGAGGVCFRTNPCPSSYSPTQWVQSTYGYSAPAYVKGTNVFRWYADRDRSRYNLGFVLVNSNDWPTLQAAAHAAATNAPHPANTWVPTCPADQSDISFIGIQPAAGGNDLWLYSPAARPVAVLQRNTIQGPAYGWTWLGSFGAISPFNLWHASDTGDSNMFYRAGFIDVNYNGNGIPDFIGAFVLGTDTNCFDSTGSPLGDYVRVMIYGLDPLSNCTVGDGIPDTWKILNGIDPLDPTVANQDPDSDGLYNRAEYLLGTHPLKASTLDASNTATLRPASPLSR